MTPLQHVLTYLAITISPIFFIYSFLKGTTDSCSITGRTSILDALSVTGIWRVGIVTICKSNPILNPKSVPFSVRKDTLFGFNRTLAPSYFHKGQPPHYLHRRCVSQPSSGWVGVGPHRHWHQEICRTYCFNRSRALKDCIDYYVDIITHST